MQQNDSTVVPQHLGLILDGNRRWAKEQGLPGIEGHRKGSETLKTVVRHAFNRGVKYISIYVFSTENWNRAKDEVDYLMKLATKFAANEAKDLIKENIKITVLGVEDRVPKNILKAWRDTEEQSKDNTGGVLSLCFNYGGDREITDATRAIVLSGVSADEVTEQMISDNLYHPEIPDVDLMIRTSGEQRISNFMLWRMRYAEMYFEPKHWPAYTTDDLDKALDDYSSRNRRFGAN